MKNNGIVCCMCCTRNWYIYLATVLYSLFKHNNVKKVYVFIEDDNIPYIQDKRVEFININNTKEYITKDSPNYTTKYSKMSYIRCYFTKLLKCDKILYIDTDTIINGNIEELWNIDLKDNVIAGVHEGGEWNKHLNTYGMNDTYINSGVLLMNLKALREEKLDDSMIYLLNHNHYWFPDQDVINLVCRNRIHYLDKTYNSSETIGIVEDAKIIHYIRGNKGWIKSSKRSEIWYKYHNEMIGECNMEKYKIRALVNFDDLQANSIRREAHKSEWLVDKERYEYLLSKNAVELIEIIPNEQPKQEPIKKEVKKNNKKK